MTNHLEQLLLDANKTLKEAVQAQNQRNYKLADNLYKDAFRKLTRYKEEFDKKFQPHYKKAEDVARSLNRGSFIADTTHVGRFPTDSSPKLSLKLSDVGGLMDTKEVLREGVIWPKNYPQMFTGNRKPWRAVLLYGPPGTGKTLLAKAIAGEAKFPFFSISPSDIVSKWMGDGEKHVKNIFQVACTKAPSIIFFDEIDSLCGQRGENNEHEASRRIKTELLERMQDVSNGVKDVLILAATNMPFALDQALRRRFDKRIYVPLPDKEARKRIFKVRIGNTPNDISERKFEELANDTKGFSGSDISYYVKDALYQPVRATLKNKFFRKNTQGMWVPCQDSENGRVRLQEINRRGENSKIKVPPCTDAHFKSVRAKHKPTVDQAALHEFVRFTKEFGIDG